MTKSPLSQSQLGIFYACQQSANPTESNYQCPALFRLPDEIDTNRLQKALELVVTAHPYLLSHTSVEEEGPVMLTPDSCIPGKDFEVPIIETDSIDRFRDTFGRPADLEKDRLFRFEIYRTADGNWFFFDIHHIVFDGTSMNVLREEIARAYDTGKVGGEILDGAQIAIQEQERRKTAEWQIQRDWYMKEFAAAVDLDSMPEASAWQADRLAGISTGIGTGINEKGEPDAVLTKEGALEKPDEGLGGYVEEDFPLQLDDSTAGAVCKRYNVGKNALFLAVWGKILADWTAQDKAVFGTIFNGRTSPEQSRAITMMVRTLPVFIDCNTETGVREMLDKTSAQLADTRSRDIYSFADLHTDLGLHTDSIFAFHGRNIVTSIGSLTFGGKTVTGRDLRVVRPGTLLDAQLFNISGRVPGSDYTLRLSYDSGRYSHEMASQIAKSFAALTRSMLTAETIGQLCPADDSQIRWLDSLNPEPISCAPQETGLAGIFRKHALEHPDADFVVAGAVRISYSKADAMTDSLASEILQAVGGSGAVVSYIIPRNELMALIPLAIVKAGCTYQPLDASYPAERLNFMTSDAGCQLLIGPAALTAIIDQYHGNTLDTDTFDWNQPRTGLEKSDLMQPDDTLVLLYTSGTTGTPKGVMLSQRNFSDFLDFHLKLVELDSASRVGSYASYGFDMYQLDLWSVVTAGCSLYIFGDDIRFDLLAIRDYAVASRLTHMCLTTQLATQLAINFPDMPHLKCLFLGGEKMASINPPHYRMINMYGPTEATCYMTSYDVRAMEKNIPIGRTNSTTRLYVVSKGGQRLPMGACGELWIAGRQVGKGYLNLPEKTAQAFVPNPFDTRKELGRCYRTGDIVRYREDGELEFIGRRDGQVKIRGFRIELKEVESVIRQFPGIVEATVQAFDLEAGGKAIAAYIVSTEKVDIAALNAFIAQEKPAYMVPAVTMQLDSIPVNVNGKVDRRKLPTPVMAPEDNIQSDAPAAPLNCLEQQLMDMIAPLATNGAFPITAPLSKIGLTSISGIGLGTQLFKRFGIKLSLKQLGDATLQSIENLILEGLLNGCGQEQGNAKTAPQPETAPAQAPLTSAQTGVFIDCLKDPQSTVYNVPFIVSFPDTVDSVRLQNAVIRVLDNHPILSAKFAGNGGSTIQIVRPESKATVTISDKSVSELEKDFVQPFDLFEGPLYRAVISGSTLLLDIHHLVTDGSSVSIIVNEICKVLDGQDLEPESCSYTAFSLRQQKTDYSPHWQWFDSRLKDIEESTSLPADLHGQEREGRLAECATTLDHKAVEQFAQAVSVTPASVYLAAFQYLAARYGNTRDVCIATVSSGRGNPDISNTVGMFVNTLALTSHIGDQSIAQYISQVAQDLGGALEHEELPFAEVAQKYGISPDIIYIYQLGVVNDFRTGGQKLSLREMELSSPKNRLSLQIMERDGNVMAVAQYNDALYSGQMIESMLSSLDAVIKGMIAGPEKPVRNLSIMTAEQSAQLEPMRAPFTAPLPVRLFHQGMENWAQRQPDHAAVIAVDGTLTYSEFDALSNRIANGLIRHGLKKSHAVVVLLPRRSTTIACIFGIMKAGGAYIPCDPEYPTERITLIAEDSGAPFIVTTADLVDAYGTRGIDIEQLLECTDSSKPEIELTPDDLAYYIYTSGSTGRPKGVKVAHGNITTFITNSPDHAMRAIMEECERILSISTISFDASISEYGFALFNGRTFVFAGEQQSKDPIMLAQLMKESHADYLGCTSSRMLQYLELPEFVECLKHCKVILQGGEKFQDLLLEKLSGITHAAILNAYGPTEVGIGCNTGILKAGQPINVGRPLPNYREWILDKDGNELPVGVTGELCVGGPGITKGYNNLPELTAAKYGERDGMRVFKTGDYARWMPDGRILILGRTDNQVKLRGLRIELGEVEAAISQVEGVRNVLVRICNIAGRDHLSAYFVADRNIGTNDMKRQISATLTAYMVPTAYLQMEAFPLSPNGKTDFRALPQPLLAQNDNEYVAPVGAAEQFFCETFQSILEVERAGATDSFFDLGGTSLVVMKLVIAAQKAGYRLTYAQVFDNSTPRELAAIAGHGNTTSETDPDADLRDFDYTAVNRVLQSNTLDAYLQSDMQSRPLGSVLLTGATGFLGIHVLRHLLQNCPDTKVHCLLRPKGDIRAQERLEQLYFYYFEQSFKDFAGSRLFVHEGDVTNPINVNAHIDTVINCAALVKHFASGNRIEETNVGGVRNCIEFCLSHSARLIQISTYSVGGAQVNGEPKVQSFTETMLFLGQRIRNQYVHSKLMGERVILDAVATRGLDAKIMRVGNLSARSEDGEFQINVKANSFMGRLNIYRMLGVLPYSAYMSPVEFSPIDETAAAICCLATTPSCCTVFHPYNSHYQMLGDVLQRMKSIGKDIRLVEDAQFIQALDEAKKDPSKQERLSAMLAYENTGNGEFVSVIPASCDFTQQVLLRQGFRWSTVAWDYTDQFLHQIDSLHFFD